MIDIFLGGASNATTVVRKLTDTTSITLDQAKYYYVFEGQ
jgi:hypothetical protein